MKHLVEQQSGEAAQTKNLPLFAFYGANTISYVGDILMALAVPWFVLQTTGSVTKTGIAAFFSTLPTIISAFFGGALVDRLGYKRMSVVSDITSGVSVGLIPLLYYTTGLAFWQLLALVFCAALLQAPGMTARSAMIPDLVAMTTIPLERANALSDGIRRVSGFMGAPLAGLLIAFSGTSNLLLVDAASFFISALLIGLAVPKMAALVSNEGVRQYVADLLEGLRFIRHNPLILTIVLTVMITNMLDEAHFAVIYPDYIKHFFGSAVVLGVLVAAFGGAAFAGTLIFGAIGHRLPRPLTLRICYILISLRFWIMALVPPLAILIVTNILSGLSAGPLNPIMSTVEQEQVPQEMRARVFGATTAGVFLGMPLGVILSGYLVQSIGIRASLLVVGACYLATTLSLLINPAVRGMEKRPDHPQAAGHSQGDGPTIHEVAP